MDVDPGHMSFERLAQSVPPAYGQLVFSQMCMHYAHVRYGAPAITFDEMRKRPGWARRTLAFWLRGAGAPEASAGQLFMPAPEVAREAPGEARAEVHREGGCEREAEFRELYYSHAGGYDQQWTRPEVAGRLARVSHGASLRAEPGATDWEGMNTFVEVGTEDSLRLAAQAAEAACKCGSGTRATFVVEAGARHAMEGLGFS